MSGHSKWSTIKHQKGVADKKRGKLFSRLSKAITIAAREGGSGDISSNAKLRVEVLKAKAENMPKDNIKRAIDKGIGKIEGGNIERLSFEAFAPNKVAMIIDCTTDNKNRTASEIKAIVEKNGGVLGAKGSTAYFFDQKGIIELRLKANTSIEDQQLELIDIGAEDIQMLGADRMRVYVESSGTHAKAAEITEQGYETNLVEVAMVPNTTVELDEKQSTAFIKFLDLIDDHEDVQQIYHNATLQTTTA